MLVQEPVHAAIWHCLNHYAYGDATFLAERLFHEIASDQALHLLATCYFRSGKLGQAYDILQTHGCNTPQTKFLFAKCCSQLNKLSEAEATLKAGGDCFFGPGENNVTESFKTNFGDASSFALQILATIYASTEREAKAKEADRAALGLNPFLFKSFESLCNRGPDHPSPYKVFNVENLATLNFSVGVNQVLNYANNSGSFSNAANVGVVPPAAASTMLHQHPAVPPSPMHTNRATSTSATSTPIVPPPPSGQNNNHNHLLNQSHSGIQERVLGPPVLMLTPVVNSAANSSSNLGTSEMGGGGGLDSTMAWTTADGSACGNPQSLMSGVHTLNYTADSEVGGGSGGGGNAPSTAPSAKGTPLGTPMATPSPLPGRGAMPPPMAKPSKVRRAFLLPNHPASLTKTPSATAKKLSYFSPGANYSGNVSFGHLPSGVVNFGSGGNPPCSELVLPSPVAPGVFSSLMVLSPCGGGGGSNSSMTNANNSMSNNENSGLSTSSNSENQKASKRSLGESNTLKSNANIISQVSQNITPGMGVGGVGVPGGVVSGNTPGGGGNNVGNVQGGPGVNSGNNTTVRRSSRLFGSSQSGNTAGGGGGHSKGSKENSKTAALTGSGSITGSTKRSKAKTSKFGGTSSNVVGDKNEKNLRHNSGTDPSDLEKTAPSITIQEAAAAGSTPPSMSHQHHQPTEVSLKALSEQALAIQKSSMAGLMDLLRLLGAAYSELSKFNSQRAISLLKEEVPGHHRSSGWVLGQMGKAHFELGQYKEAKKCFREMRDRDPHRLEMTEIYSTALWHLQEEVELSCLAQDLVRIDKLSPQAWCATGNCFSLQKEHENAIKFFKRAVQVDPSFSYAYTLLGHEYVTIEELDKALQCFRSAVRTDRRHYNAWYGIGLTYYRQERYKLTEMYYNKALAINPHNPVLICHLAVVQHALLKSDRALETLNAALSMSPKNAICKFERASILFAMENYHEALKELKELKDLVPKESPVYFLLGKVHNKLGNTHLALMHFSWAMDLDPKGANSQIKDALDPTLNRAGQEVETTVTGGGGQAGEETAEMVEIEASRDEEEEEEDEDEEDGEMDESGDVQDVDTEPIPGPADPLQAGPSGAALAPSEYSEHYVHIFPSASRDTSGVVPPTLAWPPPADPDTPGGGGVRETSMDLQHDQSL